MLAPTRVLAHQHYRVLRARFPSDVSIKLLRGGGNGGKDGERGRGGGEGEGVGDGRGEKGDEKGGRRARTGKTSAAELKEEIKSGACQVCNEDEQSFELVMLCCILIFIL